MINSLYMRMRVTHYLGIFLLITNGIFFTDNIIGSIIQYVVAGVIFLHELDEKINGVNATKKIKDYLTNLKVSDTLDINLKYSSEYNLEAVKNASKSESYKRVVEPFFYGFSEDMRQINFELQKIDEDAIKKAKQQCKK
ncbi:MAG: hypothetical protein DSZ06_00270 [Sulfurospirillum sp.]|nr:MAG: hypothetical protein DSZ06_00270 [Sulfurospirillum sp.]